MVYGFYLYPLKMQAGIKPLYVWSENPEMMRMFLIQHGVDPNKARVQMFDMPKQYRAPVHNMGIYELNYYLFGSREDKSVHKVVTTEDIMNNIVTNVAIDLSAVMSLGAAALRGDIQIFEHISKLIDQLDFIYIKDGAIADSSSEDERYSCAKDYPYYENEAMTRDDSYLYQRLYDSIYPNKLQAVTLESYVSIFTRAYIIGYGANRPEGDEFDV